MDTSTGCIGPFCSDWCCNLMILEIVFDHLNCSDLKSASLVSKSWCLGATKAFEKQVNPAIEDAGCSAAVKHGLERFRRHKQVTLNFHDAPEEATFPTIVDASKDLKFLTRLNLYFEGTIATVVCVNRILNTLISDVAVFPHLHQLELYSYGEYTWNPEEVPPVPQLKQVHPLKIEVLKVSVGDHATIGLDLSFLKLMTGLRELHVRDINFKFGHFGPPLKHFLKHLIYRPSGGFDLHLGIFWCNTVNYSRNWHATDSPALQALFDTTVPSSLTIVLQTFYGDRPIGTAWLLNEIGSKVSAEHLTKFSMELPICGFGSSRFAYISMFYVVNSFYQIYRRNMKMTILVTLKVDFGNIGKSFVEFEGTESGLCLRYGSRIRTMRKKSIHTLSQFFTMAWGNHRERTDFDTLRTYDIADDGSIVSRRQFKPNGEILGGLPPYALPSQSPWTEVEFTEPRGTLSPTSSKRGVKMCDLGLCELYTSERLPL